jgi:hypothetical protein
VVIHKTTNLINNKEYIGAHKTNNLDDSYLGSGKLIKLAIEKHGIENFEKEIILRAVSSDIMYWVENILVDKDYLNQLNVYNIRVGGHGGWGTCQY